MYIGVYVCVCLSVKRLSLVKLGLAHHEYKIIIIDLNVRSNLNSLEVESKGTKIEEAKVKIDR